MITASAGIAWSIRKDMEEHLRMLYEIRRFLVELSSKSACFMQPVEILIGCFVRPADKRLQKICTKIADRLMEKNQKDGEEIWRTVWEEHAGEIGLKQEETEIIKHAGGAFFGNSVEENEKQFSMILERLDFVIEAQRSGQKEKLHVYQTVSVMCGFLVIILLL